MGCDTFYYYQTPREHIRQELGLNLIFMVLNVTKEEQIQWVFSRHGQPKELTAVLTKVLYSYEAVNVEKEINTIEILLTKGCNPRGCCEQNACKFQSK